MELAVPKMDQRSHISFVLGSNIIKIIKNDRAHRFLAYEGENIPSNGDHVLEHAIKPIMMSNELDELSWTFSNLFIFFFSFHNVFKILLIFRIHLSKLSHLMTFFSTMNPFLNRASLTLTVFSRGHATRDLRYCMSVVGRYEVVIW